MNNQIKTMNLLQDRIQDDVTNFCINDEGQERLALELKRIIQEKKKAIMNAPDGKIRIVACGRICQYYLLNESPGGNGKYIRKTETSYIRALIQKRYDTEVVKNLERLLKAVETRKSSGKIYGLLKKIQQIRSRFPEEARNQIVPIDVPDDEYGRLWLSECNYNKTIANSYPIETELYTENGELVRSKSELNIANVLKKCGIPYIYEMPIKLGTCGVIFPDFTVLNLKNRRTIYWEHRGLMSNEEYAEKSVKRLQNYERNGIFLGDRLIISEESEGVTLGTAAIERIVKHYLL